MVSADVEEVAFCRTASWRDMFALMFRDEDESEAGLCHWQRMAEALGPAFRDVGIS